METFAYVAGRNPMPSVFREALRRTYEPNDEPLPPQLEELVLRFQEATHERLK
jgi:hypothetical protein